MPSWAVVVESLVIVECGKDYYKIITLLLVKKLFVNVLRTVDPAGVERRSRNRLRRRSYRGRGPNYIWHVDGCGKLKSFGFCIHCCIEGHRRHILWLEVGTTHVSQRNIFWTESTQQGVCHALSLQTMVQRTWTCRGNTVFFRREAADPFAGENSFLYGTSISDKWIEAWWGQLRKGCADWWIRYFKDMRDGGLYCDSDVIHVQCLRFCSMSILQDELHRPSSNPGPPPGRPDMLYFYQKLLKRKTFCCVSI